MLSSSEFSIIIDLPSERLPTVLYSAFEARSLLYVCTTGGVNLMQVVLVNIVY